MSLRATVVLPGSSRSGENATKKSFSALEAPALRGSLQSALVLLLENRQHDFFRGAGIRCTLKNHQLAGLEMGREGVRRIGDEAEVGFVIFVERSGDADDDGVHGIQAGVVGGGGKALRLGGADFFFGDAVDVRLALGEDVDLTLIDVEAGDGKLLRAEQQGQRQSHIAQADDADLRLALLDLVLEWIRFAWIVLSVIVLSWIWGTICGRVSRHRCDRWSLLCGVNFILDSSTQF